MTRLNAFADGARVAVFGATGGIGTALVALLRDDPRVARVYALSRAPITPAGKITPLHFDLTREDAIAEAAGHMGRDGPLDLVVVASGILHHGNDLRPERTWAAFSADAFARVFAINTTGPALIAKHTLPLLATDRRAAFAALSARVGSIGDNKLGGWAAYRASKAALHQVIRTCAIELARKNKTAICVALHPGTVDTGLSAPFLRGISPEKVFRPAQSAEYLLRVLNGLTPADSGGVFGWDGTRIPF